MANPRHFDLNMSCTSSSSSDELGQEWNSSQSEDDGDDPDLDRSLGLRPYQFEPEDDEPSSSASQASQADEGDELAVSQPSRLDNSEW